MDTNDAETVDALEAAAKALKQDAKMKTPKAEGTPPKYEALDHEGNTIQLDDKPRRSTVVNMSEWIPAEAQEQWQKDHKTELHDDA